MKKLQAMAEALMIRILWMWRATSLKRMPGLCPPQCSNSHTYRWPCRGRIRRPIKSKVGAYRDKEIEISRKFTETILDNGK